MMKAKIIIVLALFGYTLASAQVVGEYKYLKLKLNGKTSYHVSGKPKSLLVEPQGEEAFISTYYYGDERIKLHATDKKTVMIYKNDSLQAISSNGLKVDDDIYIFKVGSKKEWKYLKDGEVVITGTFDTRADGKFITLRYAEGIKNEELLIMMMLINGHTLERKKSAGAGVVVAAVLVGIISSVAR